jgi:hypothetical protein
MATETGGHFCDDAADKLVAQELVSGSIPVIQVGGTQNEKLHAEQTETA